MSRIIQKIATPPEETITYRMIDVNNDIDLGFPYYKYTEIDPNNNFEDIYKNGILQNFTTPHDYRTSGFVEIQEQRGGNRRIKNRRIKSRRIKSRRK